MAEVNWEKRYWENRRTSETMREELARAGAAVGTLRPILNRIAKDVLEIEAAWQAARDRKDYETADALRAPLARMTAALSYAKPNWREAAERQ